MYFPLRVPKILVIQIIYNNIMGKFVFIFFLYISLILGVQTVYIPLVCHRTHKLAR